jgi:ArsR family transcriptional regulator
MDTPISAPDVDSVTALLKALADDTRLRIAALLAPGEQCVCHIVAALELSQPNISQHLVVLRTAGVLTRERRGNWIWYRLKEQEPLPAALLRAALDAVRASATCTTDRQRLEQARAAARCT